MEPVNKEFKIKIPQLSCQNRKIFILFRNYPFQILSLSRLEDFLSFSGIIFFRYCLCQDLKIFILFRNYLFQILSLSRLEMFFYPFQELSFSDIVFSDPVKCVSQPLTHTVRFFFHLRSFWSLTLLS